MKPTVGEVGLCIVLLLTLLHVYTLKQVNKLCDLNLSTLSLTLANTESIVRLVQIIKTKQTKGNE